MPIDKGDQDNLDSQELETSLPPRSAVHPSQKGKWAKLYYFALLVVFILLTVSLMLWGKQLMD